MCFYLVTVWGIVVIAVVWLVGWLFSFWMMFYFVFLVLGFVVVLGFCLLFEKELKSWMDREERISKDLGER